MCRYILLYNWCGCYGPIFTDDYCYRILEQLDRIYGPEAWEGKGMSELPFALPPECTPGWHNTRVEASGLACQLLESCPARLDPDRPFRR